MRRNTADKFEMQMTFGLTEEEMGLYDSTNDTVYKNESVELSDEQILKNIQTLQSRTT